MAFIEQLSSTLNLWNYHGVKIKEKWEVFAVRRICLFGMSFFFFMGLNQSSSEMLVLYFNQTF